MYHHHAQEEKQAAVDPYISSGFSPATVKRTLGYPSRSTLSHWYRDYLRRGYVRGPEKRPGKFAEEQKRTAVEHYLSTGRNGSRIVRDPGYPSRTPLSQWTDELLDAFGVRRSLSKKGCPCDNAVDESTDKILKAEFVYRESFSNTRELQVKLSDYVYWYNNFRMHSTLGYMSPVEFRKAGLSL